MTQSLLIDGRGQYNCSLAAHFSNGSRPLCEKLQGQCTPQILHVLPNKTYRLRIASTTALASLNFAIGVHLHKGLRSCPAGKTTVPSMVVDWVEMEVLVKDLVQELGHGEEVSLVQVEEVLWVEVEKRLSCGGRSEEVVLRRWLDGGLCEVVGYRCDGR
ncbi:hypothetical protein ACLOJK_014679 [Asimina triloba]